MSKRTSLTVGAARLLGKGLKAGRSKAAEKARTARQTRIAVWKAKHPILSGTARLTSRSAKSIAAALRNEMCICGAKSVHAECLKNMDEETGD